MTSAQRLRTIVEVQATALMCTPTYALRLLEVAMEERLEHALESVQRVICTGEPGASLPGIAPPHRGVLRRPLLRPRRRH